MPWWRQSLFNIEHSLRFNKQLCKYLQFHKWQDFNWMVSFLRDSFLASHEKGKRHLGLNHPWRNTLIFKHAANDIRAQFLHPLSLRYDPKQYLSLRDKGLFLQYTNTNMNLKKCRNGNIFQINFRKWKVFHLWRMFFFVKLGKTNIQLMRSI